MSLSPEEKQEVLKGVDHAINATEQTVLALKDTYEFSHLKRISDILVAQELSLKELKDLRNSIG